EEVSMSRKWTLAAALVVGLAIGSAGTGEEAPKAGGVKGPATQASDKDLSEPPLSSYKLKVVTATTDATTAAVDEIERALKKPVDLRFTDTPLSDVVDFCAEHLDINIQLDAKGLTDAAVDPSAPVTFATRKPITFESALNLILEEFGLTFVIQNEVLRITSQEKADEIDITKVYYVGDLVKAIPYQHAAFGPLLNLVTSHVHPDAWGDGNSSYYQLQPFADSYVILSQCPKVHVGVTELLANLREQIKAHQADAPDRKTHVVTKRYHLGTASGEQTAEAIKKLIAPSTWQGNGGEGEICVVSRARSTGDEKQPPSDVLFIRQTGEVHDRIAELLEPQYSGGMGGGLGGGSGQGAGMFRVPDSGAIGTRPTPRSLP
ncbi:MAG TPA: hypothetical protein VG944_12490, partial [Fimbriimonas sp.]|nr:hypothetical protein [Fimbriimonas sp.]